MSIKSFIGCKIVLVILGIIFLSAGIVGLFLPLIPTTPFILLSAWCFSHSSPRLHRFLTDSKIFGTLIENWTKYRAINKKAKTTSTPVILIFFGYTLVFTDITMGFKVFVTLTATVLLIFIWSRPDGPQQKSGILCPRKKT